MKTAIFKPQMDALQRKYKNNREKLNEEMMKLYEKEHYNPMSGCLPTLISFPILFGMIDVIYKPITHIIRPGSGIIEKATEILTGLGMNTGNTMASQISVINSIQADPAPWSELGADFIAKAQSMDFSFLGVNLAANPYFNAKRSADVGLSASFAGADPFRYYFSFDLHSISAPE